MGMLNSGPDVTTFELRSRRYFHFQTNTLEIGIKPLLYHPRVMGYIVSLLFFNTVFLASNNLLRFMCHKTRKPNQIKTRSIVWGNEISHLNLKFWVDLFAFHIELIF